VVFARYAGEDGERTLALAPALGQAEESSSEQVGGEVLLGDRDLAGLPSFPEPVQVGLIDFIVPAPARRRAPFRLSLEIVSLLSGRSGMIQFPGGPR
jgi:hypothetical protein